jgi:hypothetical protein
VNLQVRGSQQKERCVFFTSKEITVTDMLENALKRFINYAILSNTILGVRCVQQGDTDSMFSGAEK